MRLHVGRGGTAIMGNPTARWKKARADGEDRIQVLVVGRDRELAETSSGTAFGAQGSTSWLCTMRVCIGSSDTAGGPGTMWSPKSSATGPNATSPTPWDRAKESVRDSWENTTVDSARTNGGGGGFRHDATPPGLRKSCRRSGPTCSREDTPVAGSHAGRLLNRAARHTASYRSRAGRWEANIIDGAH